MQHYDEVKRLVTAMSLLHEQRDHHGSRVAELARKLAIATGLPEAQADLVEVGAHLHDLGKLSIERELLTAPRRLTREERRRMQMHTTLGWAMVEQAGFDTVICEIVRHHHERYDGNGYPDRLKFQQIPIGARIVGICDTYEAMTSPRSYREAFSHAFVMAYMQKDKGKAFDGRLVDLFFQQVIPLKTA